MIDFVDYLGIRYAIIIPSNYSKDGIEFFTEQNYSQQLGYMKRPANYSIRPHKHNLNKRTVQKTQEVLFIKSGMIKVNFYSNDGKLVGKRQLEKGDVIMLCEGGHGIEFLVESEIIEVKQGPYSEKLDKEFLD